MQQNKESVRQVAKHKTAFGGLSGVMFLFYIRFGHAASLFDDLASYLKLLALACFALELKLCGLGLQDHIEWHIPEHSGSLDHAPECPFTLDLHMLNGKSIFTVVFYIDSHKLLRGLSVQKLNPSFYEVFLTLIRTKCRKGCTRGNAHSNFARFY